MSAYKLITAKELAAFIYNQPLDVEYSFATSFDTLPGTDEFDESCDPESWHGIKKTRLFDCDVIVAGQYGTFANTIIDAEYMDIEEISEAMERFFDDWVDFGIGATTKVVLSLSPVDHFEKEGDING